MGTSSRVPKINEDFFQKENTSAPGDMGDNRFMMDRTQPSRPEDYVPKAGKMQTSSCCRRTNNTVTLYWL